MIQCTHDCFNPSTWTQLSIEQVVHLRIICATSRTYLSMVRRTRRSVHMVEQATLHWYDQIYSTIMIYEPNNYRILRSRRRNSFR